MPDRFSAARMLVSALVLFLAIPGGQALSAARDLAGKRAPEFSAKRLSGEPWSLASHAGKTPVLLTFWSIYCKSCTEELSALQRLVETHGPGKVTVVAVNEDTDVGIGRVRSFLKNFAAMQGGGSISFPVLFDPRGEIFRKYMVDRLPTLFYIDERGIVREVIEGYEPGKETAVSAAIGKLLARVSPEPLREVAGESIFELEVSAPICGVYRDGKWYRPLDLDESGRPEAIARARARGEEHLRREALRLALSDLGVRLLGEARVPTCEVPYGTDLRMPWSRPDTLDLLLERLTLPRVMETVAQETVERERDLWLYRRIRIALPALREQMASAGYAAEEGEFRVRFLRASFPEERSFVAAVREQFRYLSDLRQVSSPKAGTEYRLSAFASPDTVVQELRKVDVGARKFSVDLLPGNILEVSVWR